MCGFEDEELARLLTQQEVADGLTDEDAVPEMEQAAVTVPGDLWVLGDHRVRRQLFLWVDDNYFSR